ncbi:Glutathione peroxidase, partial [Armadillidium vulgare]
LEPGSGMEIYNAVKYVNPGGGFEPKLTYFQKVNTNGAGASEIYTFLKSNCPFISDTFRDGIFYSPLQVGDVHWNFEKFLLGRDGRVYYRYNPSTYDAKDLIPDIEYLLSVNTTTTVILFIMWQHTELEPGSGMEIYNAVKYVNPGGGFEPKLTYFQKVNTNGAGASEIYTFLKSNCPFISDTFRDGTYYSPLQVGDVHWNFEKFLLGRDGRVYYRYNPSTYDAKDLIPDIEYLLSVNTTATV